MLCVSYTRFYVSFSAKGGNTRKRDKDFILPGVLAGFVDLVT